MVGKVRPAHFPNVFGPAANQALDAEAKAHQTAAREALSARDQIRQTLEQTQTQIDQVTAKLKDGLTVTLDADTTRFDQAIVDLDKALAEKAAKYGVSANAIATAWVLRHPAKIQIVLGSMNPTRLGEMLDGADIDLDKQDWWDLYVAAGNLIP